MPTFSIIIPIYNQAHFLPQTVESVLAQTYTDYELILINDGSTDNTAEVIQQYTAQATTIWQENQGLAGARNTGIRAATGKFIAFLDSDDLWQPNHLATIASLIEHHPQADMFHTGWCYIDASGTILPQAPNAFIVPSEQAYPAMLRGNFLNGSSYVARKKALVEAGFFDVSFRRLQDWELWLRMLSKGAVLVGSPACLVHYRLHGSSLSVDPAGGQQAAQAIATKQVGPPAPPWTPPQTRLYGGVYRYAAITSALIRAHDWHTCGQYLRQALQIDPSLATDPSLFYELALGTQPLGYRGTPQFLTLAQNEQAISHLLQTHLKPHLPAPLYQQALSMTYLALGQVAYAVGNYPAARRHLTQAGLKGAIRDKHTALLWLKSWANKPIRQWWQKRHTTHT